MNYDNGEHWQSDITENLSYKIVAAIANPKKLVDKDNCDIINN